MPPYEAQLDLSDVPGTCRWCSFRPADAAPRLLIIDDEAFDAAWDHMHGLPLSQRTTLVLRKTKLAQSLEFAYCPVLNLVLDQCSVHATTDLLEAFPKLEVLIACRSSCLHNLQQFDWLPTSGRHIHILQSDLDVSSTEPASTATFPALESLTFTWLQPDTTDESGSPAADDADPLSDLRKFVEATIVVPRCTFKYLRSTESPEDALADAMADLELSFA